MKRHKSKVTRRFNENVRQQINARFSKRLFIYSKAGAHMQVGRYVMVIKAEPVSDLVTLLHPVVDNLALL